MVTIGSLYHGEKTHATDAWVRSVTIWSEALPPPSPSPSPPPPSPSPPPPSPSPPPPSPSPPPPSPSPPPSSPPPRSPPYVFTSKASLQTAVQAYNANPTVATATYGPIVEWGVSDITDMYQLFYALTNFNVDISSWDTSGVTNMGWMFRVCPAPVARI